MHERSDGMSLYDRDYVREQQQPSSFPRPKTVVGSLIVINVAIFLLDVFIFTGKLSQGGVFGVFSDTAVHPLEWWRVFTYGFIHDHETPFHLFGNMLGLYFFGSSLEQTYGSKRFLSFYLTAVILCGAVFVTRHFLMNSMLVDGRLTNCYGASGAVFATIIAFALRFPHRKVYLWMTIPVPAWALATGYIFIELTSLNQYDHIAHDVHLTGAAYGFIFVKTGWELSFLAPSALGRLFRAGSGAIPSVPKRKPKVKLYDPEAKSQKLDQEADRLLDKLHREGADSLTAKERKLLEEYSRRVRQRKQ